MAANTPVIHSPDSGSTSPYISGARSALGFKRAMRCALPVCSDSTAASDSMMVVLPPPAAPTSMMPCRTRVVSYSWMTLLTHPGWYTSFSRSTCAARRASTW